jgi:hypothetical protein
MRPLLRTLVLLCAAWLGSAGPVAAAPKPADPLAKALGAELAQCYAVVAETLDGALDARAKLMKGKAGGKKARAKVKAYVAELQADLKGAVAKAVKLPPPSEALAASDALLVASSQALQGLNQLAADPEPQEPDARGWDTLALAAEAFERARAGLSEPKAAAQAGMAEPRRLSVGGDLSGYLSGKNTSFSLGVSLNYTPARFFEVGTGINYRSSHADAGAYSSDSSATGADLSAKLLGPLGRFVPFLGGRGGVENGTGGSSFNYGPVAGAMFLVSARTALNLEAQYILYSGGDLAGYRRWNVSVGLRQML